MTVRKGTPPTAEEQGRSQAARCPARKRFRLGRTAVLSAVLSTVFGLAAVRPTLAVGIGSGTNFATSRPVTVALLAPPQSLNPILDADQYGTDIDRLLYRTLVTETPDLKITPDLARSWKVSDQGRVYTYTLGDDARWTDRQPVTAQDVVWTLDTFRNPSDGSPAQTQFSDVESVTAKGRNTVVVRLYHAWAPWTSVVAETPILPGHALSQVVGAKAIVESPILNRKLITDGPYRLESWQRRSGTVILRASHVDPNVPSTQIQTVIFRVIADPSAAMAALRAGDVQVAPVPVESRARLTAVAKASHAQIVITPELAVTWIGFNLEDPLFQNATVREALTLAVNRPAILRRAYDGLGTVPNGPLPPTSWAYDGAIAPAPYSPIQAKRLLAQVGFRPGTGGILTKGHLRLAFGLAYTRGTPELSAAVAMAAKDLKKIGVQVTLLPMQFGTLNGLALVGKFDAIAEGWAYGPDPNLRAVLGGQAAFPPKGLDITRYADPTVTRLLNREATSGSRGQRVATFAALTQAFAHNPPYIPLVAGESLTAVSDQLLGYVGNPAGPDFYDVQDWRWAAPAQRLSN